MAGRMTAWMALVKSLRDLNPDPQAGREWGEGRDWCWHGLLKPQSPAQWYTSSSKAIPFPTSSNPSNFFKQFHFLLTKHSNICSYVGHSYSNSNIFHPPPCLDCSYLWKYSTAFVFLFRFLAHSFLQIYQRDKWPLAVKLRRKPSCCCCVRKLALIIQQVLLLVLSKWVPF